jgi:signal transduction histidine kinase
MQLPNNAAEVVGAEVVGDAAAACEAAARAAERYELARELHDTVIQPLASLLIGLDTSQYDRAATDHLQSSITEWADLAREAVDALRRTLAGLRTHRHAELGLPEALRRFVVPQMRAAGLKLVIEASQWPDDLPLDYTSNLYLAVREALTNVEKHANARQVAVMLRAEASLLMITVADDGRGFPPSGPRAYARHDQRVHLGIEGMRQRLRTLGGHLALASSPGAGARLEMRVPTPACTAQGAQAVPGVGVAAGAQIH